MTDTIQSEMEKAKKDTEAANKKPTLGEQLFNNSVDAWGRQKSAGFLSKWNNTFRDYEEQSQWAAQFGGTPAGGTTTQPEGNSGTPTGSTAPSVTPSVEGGKIIAVNRDTFLEIPPPPEDEVKEWKPDLERMRLFTPNNNDPAFWVPGNVPEGAIVHNKVFDDEGREIYHRYRVDQNETLEEDRVAAVAKAKAEAEIFAARLAKVDFVGLAGARSDRQFLISLTDQMEYSPSEKKEMLEAFDKGQTQALKIGAAITAGVLTGGAAAELLAPVLGETLLGTTLTAAGSSTVGGSTTRLLMGEKVTPGTMLFDASLGGGINYFSKTLPRIGSFLDSGETARIGDAMTGWSHASNSGGAADIVQYAKLKAYYASLDPNYVAPNSFKITTYAYQGSELYRGLEGIDPRVGTGHFGWSIDGGLSIKGFGPVQPKGMPSSDFMNALRARMDFPGKLTDDTQLFKDVALGQYGKDMRVFSREFDVSPGVFERFQGQLENGVDGLRYRFPDPNGYDFRFMNWSNCAQYPTFNGLRLPNESGQMKYFMSDFVTNASPWKPK